MNNIYRINKILMIIGIWFAAFAVLVLAVGILLMVRWANFSKTCESTQAVITDIYASGHGDSRTYHVIVDYQVDGENYSGQLGYYNSSMRRGQTVTVYYDPKDPGFTMESPYLACGIMSIFVLVFGGIGFGFVASEFRNKRIINRLADEDKYIILDARTERREVRAGVKVNRVHYVQTDFIYRDQFGNEYVFSSRPYPPGKCPFDPYQSVTVYVDLENNPKKYYVYTDNEYYTGEKERFFDDSMR